MWTFTAVICLIIGGLIGVFALAANGLGRDGGGVAGAPLWVWGLSIGLLAIGWKLL